MKLNTDWFWIGTHSYTLTSFIKLKPLASLHCNWLRDIHQANTSPTYYIRYHISYVDRSLPHSSLVMGDLPLLYLLTFFNFGRWEEENQEAARMWHFHWFLMRIGRNERILSEASQSVGSNPKVTRTLRMISSWWLRMGDPACMCITQCKWSEHYHRAGRLLQAILRRHQDNYHLADRDWLHDLMTLPGCSIIIIDLFSLYPGLHMCKQGLPVNTGSLAACWWSRVWAAVGTVASRVTAGCWDCVILW